MTPKEARHKRGQLIDDGFCVIDDVLTEAFLRELRDESDRLMVDWVRPDEFKYQGEHVVVKGEDNEMIQAAAGLGTVATGAVGDGNGGLRQQRQHHHSHQGSR